MTILSYICYIQDYLYNICYTALQISPVQTLSVAIYQSMLYCVVGDEQGTVMQAGSQPSRFVITDLPVMILQILCSP